MVKAGRPYSGRWRAGACALIVIVLSALALAAPLAEAKDPKIKVLTRNLYLGSDLTAALTAPDGGTLAVEATKIYESVVDTNFPARAERLANEIDRKRPHLIGLQEVAKWRRGAAGVTDGPVTPARERLYDFLRELRAALRDLGLRYRVAARQVEANVEVPTSRGWDLRLTMRDVILAKRGKQVRIDDSAGGHFATQLPVPTPLGTIESTRGWTRVDARVRGRGVRFVNAHLESVHPVIRAAQAFELASPAGPIGNSGQRILVGDLNSDPAAPSPDSDAYNAFITAGYTDNGVSVPTFGHDPDLLNANAAFTERIDHVLTKPAMKTVASTVLGDEQGNRTPYGLWPSDHGGVFSRLR